MKRRPDAPLTGAERPREGRGSVGPRYWLISKPHHGRADALTLGLLAGDGRALPVFSFKEEAKMFLRARGASRGDWEVWEAGARDILPLLLGPSCAGVEKVVLDPMPGVADAVSACLVGASRERFAARLVEYLRGRAKDEVSVTPVWDDRRGDGCE